MRRISSSQLVQARKAHPLVGRAVPREIRVGGERKRALAAPLDRMLDERAPDAASHPGPPHGKLLKVWPTVDEPERGKPDRLVVSRHGHHYTSRGEGVAPAGVLGNDERMSARQLDLASGLGVE